jgi:glycosyltransferase involved in cell wall biosynthesis
VAAKKLSFVVPVYRNERALTVTHDQLSKLLAEKLATYDAELVFVDDGSDDGSLAELKTLRDKDPRVKILSFTRNFGQMAAMLAGFQAATGDAIINLSADLQDPVELIAEMVASWEKGSEIVVCHREGRQDGLRAAVISRLAYALLRISVPQIPRGGFDFTLIDRKALDSFNSIDVRNRYFQGDLLWFGYRTHFIPYVRRKRMIGRSQYNFRKRLKNLTDAVIDSSYWPIRMMSLFGLATGFFGFLYAISVLVEFFRGGLPFQGWAPLMMVLLFMGGGIMTMLGVLGEYVWRIFDEVRKKPNYVIRDRIP